jgi:hypothetical protein
MVDMKQIIGDFKELLKDYGFKQKGASRVFFYDCNWYFISAYLDTIKNGFFIRTGIKFWCDQDKAINTLIYDDVDAKMITVNENVSFADECVWINGRKEYLLEKYKTPMDMLHYFKKMNDYFNQPHGYFISRLLDLRHETIFFKDLIIDMIEMYNKPPYWGIYGAGVHKGKAFDERPRDFVHFVEDIETIFEMTDDEFKMEILKRINMNRKKQKLNILEKII